MNTHSPRANKCLLIVLGQNTGHKTFLGIRAASLSCLQKLPSAAFRSCLQLPSEAAFSCLQKLPSEAAFSCPQKLHWNEQVHERLEEVLLVDAGFQ